MQTGAYFYLLLFSLWLFSCVASIYLVWGWRQIVKERETNRLKHEIDAWLKEN